MPLGRREVLAIALLATSIRCDEGRKPEQARETTQPSRATLRQLSGTVRVKRAAGDDWVAAAEQMPLYENDKVRTGTKGAARLDFENGTSVGIGEDALVGIAETRLTPETERSDLTILQGRIEAELGDPEHKSLSLTTPSAVVRAGREIVFQ